MGKELLYFENVTTDGWRGHKLDHVTFAVEEGETYGIVALNGNGLIETARVLLGRTFPSSGKIFINGKEAAVDSPEKAMTYGIAEISESTGLVPYMSAAENLSISREISGQEILRSPKRNYKRMDSVIKKYNLSFEPYMVAQRLTYLQRTQLLICRALLRGANLLICSELGAGFSNSDIDEFKSFLGKIRDEKISLLILNSDIKTTICFSDRIAVMRNGMLCYSRKSNEALYDDVLKHMHCENEPINTVSLEKKWGANEFSFENCGIKGVDSADITMSLKGGRVQGFFINNKDREEEIHNVFSGITAVKGRVWENRKKMSFSRWMRNNSGNVYCIGRNFVSSALYENLTVADNIALRTFGKFNSRGGLLNKKMLNLALKDFCISHGVPLECLSKKPRHLDRSLRDRLVLLGVMFYPPKLLVLNNPLYAADEEVKHNLLYCINSIKECNTAVLWCSSEDAVLYDYCDDVIKAL